MKALLVDAGNTRLKWMLRELSTDNVLARGSFPTGEIKRADDLFVYWQAALALSAQSQGITQAMFVSVAADAVNEAINEALSRIVTGQLVRFRSVARLGAMENRYAEPGQLGADRLAAALGAWGRVGDDCLVVNCGTATTIDVVRSAKNCAVTVLNEPTPARPKRGFLWLPSISSGGSSTENASVSPPQDRDSLHLQNKSANATLNSAGPQKAAEVAACFCGGVILPGWSLMKASLQGNTARLPNAAGQFVGAPGFPENTDDAIETGCLLAQCGAIEAMHHRLEGAVPIVLSGGAAAALRPLLIEREFTVIDAPELVLEGLALAILQG